MGRNPPTEAELLIYVITLGSRQENIIVQLTNIEFYPNETRAIKHFPHTIFKTSTSYLNHNHTSHQSPISASTVKSQDTRDEYPSKPQLAVDRNLPLPKHNLKQPKTTPHPPQQKKPAPQHYSVAGRDYDGGYLLSHILNAIPSALTSLTSLFGMGRGGTSSLLPPKIYIKYSGSFSIIRSP